ncbi:MAG: hypothetical protein HYY17_06230 [Planctomycetes bacterium]|nr:hypothetical protein [Planctomycetota bacterium]
MEEETRVRCPSCAEIILQAARICRHCGEILDPKLKAEREAAKPNPLSPQARLQARVNTAVAVSAVCTFLLAVAGLASGLIMFLSALIYRREARKIGMAPPRGIGWIFVCAALSFLLGGAFVGFMAWKDYKEKHPPATLYVDNGLDVSVTLSIDGKEKEAVGPKGLRKMEVDDGAHRIVVRDAGGTVLIDETVTFTGKGKYILNPGAKWDYEVHTGHYSTMPAMFGGGSPDPVPLPGKPVMDVSAYHFILEPLPGSVTMEGYGSSTRTAVLHAAKRE